MAFGILYREELKEYDFGAEHPFHGDRFSAFINFLKERLPPNDHYVILAAEPAGEEDLLTVCSRDYIDFTREFYKAAYQGLSYPGNFFRYHSMDNVPAGKPGKLEEAARLIVGQAKRACQLVMEGKFQKVMSIGGGLHHAKPSFGEGFCLYNDVAFCARHLINQYSLKRVVILDTDAHAGNGTFDYFREEPRVLFIDLHQDPHTLYPGTGFAQQIGEGAGKGFKVNIPLPPYAGYDSYKLAFDSVVEPVVREFQPEIIIRNGGSDPHFSDGLTKLGLPVAGFRMIGEKVKALAELCGGREIDLIASGYNARVLPHSWLALMCGLAGINLEIEEPEPVPQRLRTDAALPPTKQMLSQVRSYLKDYWKCLR